MSSRILVCKTISLFFLVFVCLTNLQAKEVTLSMMKEIAQNFSELEMEGRDVYELKEILDNKLLGFFCSFEGGGYAIFTKNTNHYPILSYSKSGNLQIGNDDVQWQLILNVLRQLSKVMIDDTSVLEKNNAKWNEYLYRIKHKGVSLEDRVWGPLLKTEWGQQEPFNKYCPLIDENGDKRRYVGCAAVALGQVLYYLEFTHGIELFQYDSYGYNYKGKEYAFPADSRTLAFPNFQELNEKTSDLKFDDSEDEVAAFLFSVGTLLESQYKNTGTTTDFNVHRINRTGLSYTVNHYKYARDNVIRNIKERRPVVAELIFITNPSRHAVVIDGYRDSDDFFHVNFGWDGSSNGWWYEPFMDEYKIFMTYYDIGPLDSTFPSKAGIVSPKGGNTLDLDKMTGRYFLKASNAYDRFGFYTTESRFYVGKSPDSMKVAFGSRFDWGYEDKREIETKDFEPGIYYWKVVKRGGSGFSESETDSFTIDMAHTMDRARVVGIHDPKFVQDLHIYPNPCTNFINVEASQVKKGVMKVVAMNGKEVFSIRMDGNSKPIDVSYMQSGVYIVTIKSKDFLGTQKIVKL